MQAAEIQLVELGAEQAEADEAHTKLLGKVRGEHWANRTFSRLGCEVR